MTEIIDDTTNMRIVQLFLSIGFVLSYSREWQQAIQEKSFSKGSFISMH